MATTEPEQPSQTNGSDTNHQHHPATATSTSASIAAPSAPLPTPPSMGGGFTAVNGIINKPITSTTNSSEESHAQSHPPTTQPPAPAAGAAAASTSIPITNGNIPPIESNRSSPTVNAIHPRRPSSSDSLHSPPRKRSYPEAFGDRDESTTPKREGYSDDRKSMDRDYRSGENDEQRIASEALRRENEASRRESTSLNGDDRSFPEYERTPAGALIDMDRKKRKRVFSNRTKTGCMTCRKRKKKCDEMHPECNNCLRGGFVCEGYSTRNTWQKPNASKVPVPLQSKEGPSAYQHTLTQPAQAPTPTAIRYSDDYSSRPEIKAMEDSRRLSPHNESRPGLYNPPIPPPYSGPSQVSQVSGPYGDRPIESRPPLPKPELHEHPESSSYAALQMGPRPPLIPPQHHHQQQQQPPPPPPPAHHGPPPPLHGNPPQPPPLVPPMMDTPPQRPSSHHRIETERDKMLRGEYFLPYTPALMADRDQCALAVWRFNNSTNPTMGIKLEDRMNFFKDIVNLRPSPDPNSPPGPPDPNDPPIVGHVGTGVIVEAPFSCDYGYNISIGNDVVIGADCRITDTCSVHIGNNVVFSPGVRLMCATYAIDPKERKKGKGRALGRQIVIEDDVWIGSNVIILPGVKIGRCTTIGAGSLLHKDVPPYVVVAGNPPKVVRGIYDDGRAS